MKKIGMAALIIFFTALASTPASAYGLGISWINYDNLYYCDESANGFKNELDDLYSVDYEEFEEKVLKSHFTDNGYSLDKPHIAFHCGHSTYDNNGVMAIQLHPESGSTMVKWDEVHFGDYNLDWFGAQTCELLNENDEDKWIHATDGGLHLFCGFDTEAEVNDVLWMGRFWGYYLDDGEKVKDAWFHACDVTQKSDKVANIITQDNDCYNDYIYGRGGPACDDPTPKPYYWAWRHWC